MDIYAEALAAARAALAQLDDVPKLQGSRSTVPLVGSPWLDLLTLWSADTGDGEKVEAARRLAHGQFSLKSLFPPPLRPLVVAAVRRWGGDDRPLRLAWEDLVLGPILVAGEDVRRQTWPYWLGVNTVVGRCKVAPDHLTMSLGDGLAAMRRTTRRAVEAEVGAQPLAATAAPAVELWDVAAALEAQERWRAVLATCSPRQRAILEAALAVGEPDWAAVARQLGLAEATVRVQVSRLRKKVGTT